MKTAEQMYAHMKNNGLGKGMFKRVELKHFKIIENMLMREVEVLTCFMGIHNYQTMTKHDGTYAYAITEENLILARKTLFNVNIDIVQLSDIKAIYKETGNVYGRIIFETDKGSLLVGIDNISLENVYESLESIVKNKNTNY